MLLLLIFLVLLIAGIRLLYSKGELSYIAGVFMSGSGGLGLIVGLLSLPVHHTRTQADMREVEAIRVTLNAARARGENVENAALQLKVAEANAWIASTQYLNGTVLDLWIPDAVDSLKPIQ